VFAWTGPTSIWTHSRVRTDTTNVCTDEKNNDFFILYYINLFFCVHADAACVRADGILPWADAVKTRPRVKLRPRGKNGRTRSSGQ
jgi:hypothetical protein